MSLVDLTIMVRYFNSVILFLTKQVKWLMLVSYR